MIKICKEAFHGKGHQPYKSREAKLAFSDSLLKASDKMFFAPFVPLVTLAFFEFSKTIFLIQLLISLLMFIGAGCMRHEALVITDNLSCEKENEPNT